MKKPIDGKEVIRHFESLGAILEDDFFYYERLDKVPPWQAISIYTATFFFNKSQVYPDESQVDSIFRSYLFSSTPIEFFERFNEAVLSTHNELKAPIYHNGEQVEPSKIDFLKNVWLNDLEDELAEEPGAESLAILIQELIYNQ
jgi:hypothetical protein